MNWWMYEIIFHGTVFKSEGFFETEEDAEAEARKQCNIYADFIKRELSIRTSQHWANFGPDLECEFEDAAFCEYADSMEYAIVDVYEKQTGREFQEEGSEDVERFCNIREDLAERFHGCYPANITLTNPASGEEEDVPCCHGVCEYHCERCPMLYNGGAFPEYEEGNGVREAARNLIRCVKCDQEYAPTEDEIADAIRIVCQ